jgi:hypothetical protein
VHNGFAAHGITGAGTALAAARNRLLNVPAEGLAIRLSAFSGIAPQIFTRQPH